MGGSMSDWTPILAKASVIPVIVIDNADDAVPLARTLVDAGLPILEITLRTSASTQAIKRIIAEVPDAIVGAGTVLDPAQVEEMRALGARFLVSPGYTPSLLDAVDGVGLPMLAGGKTMPECMYLRERGFKLQKFFPARLNGGVEALQAIGAVIGDIAFCPTGGINEADYKDYLALPNVACVGGSWIAPSALIADNNWQEIARRALAVSES